jgi:maleylacetoacetate isomerase
MLKLYSYYRSSASFRVRIALNIKQLDYQTVPVHLLKNGGEQHNPAYNKLNALELVPTLDHDGNILTQSLAIIEYLEEQFNGPSLLPSNLVERAHARAFAQSIACEIQPLNNLRVSNYLLNDVHINEEQKVAWQQHWFTVGLTALETQLTQQTVKSKCCFGNEPTVADICLIPQLATARRFNIDLAAYPRLQEVEAYCLELPAFIVALPKNQPDAE